MRTIVVIGATGDVGQGINRALLDAGHRVIGVARDSGRLSALTDRVGTPERFAAVAGTLDCDDNAEHLLTAVRAVAPRIDGVVVSINGPRKLPGLLALPTDEFAALLAMDLTAHFTAARAFLPAVAEGGSYIGIGGGSADFILAGGAHMSIAQAGLRMLYRGLHQEQASPLLRVMLLTIASVVNAPANRASADPLWVTDDEVGSRVAAIIAAPADYPDPVWRLSRRGGDGVPGFAADTPTRVQGLTS